MITETIGLMGCLIVLLLGAAILGLVGVRLYNKRIAAEEAENDTTTDYYPGMEVSNEVIVHD